MGEADKVSMRHMHFERLHIGMIQAACVPEIRWNEFEGVAILHRER